MKKDLIIACIIFLFLALGGIVYFRIASTPSTNADGTSKTAVYTKIADFGNYSDWAQSQLKAGHSLCSLQNALAQADKNVPVVPNCDTSVNCTSTNVGFAVNTNCSATP